MGDSYATGTGAGHMIQRVDGGCFRFDKSYPVVLNYLLQPGPSRFNYVACYGETFSKIIQNQFRDKASMLGRPSWGNKPEFVTLSMGGNDIGFRDLIQTCVYSLRVFSRKGCDEVIRDSMRSIHSLDFVRGANDVIAAALRKGTARVGQGFKVYVTGYAQFFNEQTTQCNHVTFRPALSPFPPEYLTIERRKALNKLARDLNTALKTAVATASISAPNKVFFVDYDEKFEGHRFCDREEPNAKDPDTWFLTFGSEAATMGDFPNSVPRLRDLLSGQSNETISESEYLQFIGEAAQGDRPKMASGLEPLRTFHPKAIGHQIIAWEVMSKILATRALSTNTAAMEAS